MKRREFITLLGGAAVVWPGGAWAQQSDRMRRVGILMPFSPSDAESQKRIQAFKEKMRSRGWVAGETVQFDERWTTDNMDLIRSAAANLVELKTEAILAVGGRVVPILMQLTRTIPIVVPGGIDPVARGWVASIAHPGGNVTGFAMLKLSVISKMLQTLKEIAPTVSRVAMIYNPDNPAATLFVSSFEPAARALGIEPIISHIHGLADIEGAVASMAAHPNGGIFCAPDVTVSRLIEQTVAVVARHRLPAIYSERVSVNYGGLVYYGVDRVELYRGAASYVDRILRGDKPGDLPYQQPTKYELVINLKTATTLGLEVPPKLLFTADEVIE